MKHGERPHTWLPLACACATACLPRGDPPAGRQVIADNTSALVDLLAASPGGTLRLLVARPRPEPNASDVYLVSVPPDGSAPGERLLFENVPFVVGCLRSPCFSSDASGRLFLFTDYDPSIGASRLVRADPETGDRTDFGFQSSFEQSPSRQRFVTTTYDPVNGKVDVTLHEADDRAVPLTRATSAVFVGEDLFYVTEGMQLMRVQPDAAPELARTNVSFFQGQNTEVGPRLVLFLVTDDPTVSLASVIDPVTLNDVFGPFASGNPTILSPDGRWIAANKYDAASSVWRLTLVETATGIEEPVDVPGFGAVVLQWRPGHSELWGQLASTSGEPAPTLLKRPGTAPILLSPAIYSFASGYEQSFFTPDGRYWFSAAASETQNRTTIGIGPADDPTGPVIDLNPDGTASYTYYALADGRLLVEAFYTVPERSDLYAFDPATGTRSLFGKLGRVLSVGDRRVLATLHVGEGRGDLTAIDVETGGATTLAAEAATTALVERGEGADPVPAGARVVYQFRARFESPYDGIWIATLP